MSEQGAQTSSQILFALGDSVFAIDAGSVARIVAMPGVVPLPFLPKGLAGATAVAGAVVPLIALPTKANEGHELILFRHGGGEYGLRVDRVLRMSAREMDTVPVQFLDVAALVGDIGSIDIAFAAEGSGLDQKAAPRRADVSEAPSPPDTRSAVLAVETAHGTSLLPLTCVVELLDTVPIVALPDSRNFLLGAALYRGGLLPVVSLSALQDGERADDKRPGAFVVIAASDRRCILAVKSLVGLKHVDPEQILDLNALLAGIFSEPEANPVSMQTRDVEAEAATSRYLLIDYAGCTCAFELMGIAHIHDPQPLLRVPGAKEDSAIAGVVTIGGRIVPVFDLGKIIGFAGSSEKGCSLIELKYERNETFVVQADRILGMASIPDDTLLQPPEGSAISARATVDAKTVWVLDPQVIAREAGWRLHAA